MKPTFLPVMELRGADSSSAPATRWELLLSDLQLSLAGVRGLVVWLACCHLLQLLRLQHPKNLTGGKLSLPQTTSVSPRPSSTTFLAESQRANNNNLSAGIVVISEHAVHVLRTPTWTLNGSPSAKAEYCLIWGRSLDLKTVWTNSV